MSQMAMYEGNLAALVSPTLQSGGTLETIYRSTKVHRKNGAVVEAACRCVDSLARTPLGRARLGDPPSPCTLVYPF